jgi:LysM repeat protein
LFLVLAAGVAAGPPASGPGGCGETYRVVRGDTLYSIARRCRATVVGLAEANRLADPRRIEVGQILVMRGPDVPFPEGPGKPEPDRAPDAALAYNFRPGDTIYSLARWARVSVGRLIAANPGIDPHKIEIGDSVRLPPGAVAPDAGRLREFGTGPGPALVRPDEVMLRRIPTAPPPRAAAPRPRAQADQPRPAPPAPPPRPRRDKPDDEREPEGM